MSKGILIYALNNEQIDYVKLAVNAAQRAKKYINVQIALVTDSADWLYQQYPNWNEYFDFVIRIVDQSGIENWYSGATYSIGSLVYYNGTIWRKVKEGNEVINIFEKRTHEQTFDIKDLERIYEGLDIDKWYPNLPYLKGQHVWHQNTLYRCEIGYTEQDSFSKEKYVALIENVQDFEQAKNFNKGDILLYNRVLWQSNSSYISEITEVSTDTKDLKRIYEGIDIDKWYPNLPYLKGQHVWYDNVLYRCHTDYEEKDEFSPDKYDILIERVKDLSHTFKFFDGDILLHNRVLWQSEFNYDATLVNYKIREDLWEDTRERFLVHNSSVQYRRYFDGTLSHKRLRFRNDIRIRTFELSPFDETLVIDSDFLINNDILKYCWEQPHDFLIHKKAIDLSGYRYDPRLQTVSDKGVDFYWATVFFFRKNKNTETFFNLLGHIQENWNYYRLIYQIEHSLYRNDYAFSIAIHIMNGYQDGYWAHDLPGKMYYTTDRDILIEDKDGVMKFLIEKEKYLGEYTLLKTNKLNIHVMNKYSISRILDQPHDIEYSL